MCGGKLSRSAGREMACCPVTGEECYFEMREKTSHTNLCLDAEIIEESKGGGTVVQPHKPICAGLMRRGDL